MPIPPTIRSNRRYLALKVLARSGFTPNQVIQGIRLGVLEFLGELGVADAEFDVVEYDHETLTLIVRSKDTEKDKVIQALTFIDSIQGKKAGVMLLGVSGTIKKAREKFLEKERKPFKGHKTQIYERQR